MERDPSQPQSPKIPKKFLQKIGQWVRTFYRKYLTKRANKRTIEGMKKPSKQQKAYVEARARGLSRDQSALTAGYAPGGSEPNVSRIENSLTVQEQLAAVRAEVAKNTGITKEEVVGLLMHAADMAKLMSDPTGLVAAARELGKMLGFYAPEVKKVTHGLDKGSLRALLEEMSDEDLARIANAKAIEGEVKRLPDDGS